MLKIFFYIEFFQKYFQASFALTVQGCGYLGPILLDFSKCKAFAFQCFALYTVAWVPVPTFPSLATEFT